MFGILDRLYTSKKKGIIHEEGDWRPVIEYKGDPSNVWYCFVPKLVMRNKRVREGILPRNGKVVAYTISYVNLIVPDAEQTRDNLRLIYKDAVIRINEDLDQYRTINLIGVSLGNVLAVRCASILPEKKPKNLISIVGGSRLGFSAWDSIATSYTTQNSGCDSVYEYEQVLREFSPVENLVGVSAEKVFARFGSSDLMIRYNPHGRELRDALVKMPSDVKDIKVYPFFDHSAAIMFSGIVGVHR